MKKPSVSDFRTFATIQTNASKILYGSGAVGAGFRDDYHDFKTVRGKLTQRTVERVLEDSSIIQVNVCDYIIRYETALMQIIDLQARFVIQHRGKPLPTLYTLISWTVEEIGKEAYFVFKLAQYGK